VDGSGTKLVKGNRKGRGLVGIALKKHGSTSVQGVKRKGEGTRSQIKKTKTESAARYLIKRSREGNMWETQDKTSRAQNFVRGVSKGGTTV